MEDNVYQSYYYELMLEHIDILQNGLKKSGIGSKKCNTFRFGV